MANEFITRKGLVSRGGITLPYRAINSTSSATKDDYFIDCTGGTFTLSLLSAASIAGFILVIKNTGSGTVTIDPDSGETIDGFTSIDLSSGETITIESNGTNWTQSNNFYRFFFQSAGPSGSNVIPGSFWMDSNNGKLYVYVKDQNTSQWVAPIGTAGPTGPQGPNVARIANYYQSTI